eukprot:Platyproteum_vivax@DN13141_c0_g1_i1.p1
MVLQKAPNFRAPAVMPSGNIKMLELEAYVGKYVLIVFYSFDFVRQSMEELSNFSEAIKEFQDRDIQIFGCSVDSPMAHQQWLKQFGNKHVEFPLLSDVSRNIISVYTMMHPDGMGNRGLVLMDRDHIIRYQVVNDTPLSHDVKETLRIIDELQNCQDKNQHVPYNLKRPHKVSNWSSDATYRDPVHSTS